MVFENLWGGVAGGGGVYHQEVRFQPSGFLPSTRHFQHRRVAEPADERVWSVHRPGSLSVCSSCIVVFCGEGAEFRPRFFGAPRRRVR